MWIKEDDEPCPVKPAAMKCPSWRGTAPTKGNPSMLEDSTGEVSVLSCQGVVGGICVLKKVENILPDHTPPLSTCLPSSAGSLPGQ